MFCDVDRPADPKGVYPRLSATSHMTPTGKWIARNLPRIEVDSFRIRIWNGRPHQWNTRILFEYEFRL